LRGRRIANGHARRDAADPANTAKLPELRAGFLDLLRELVSAKSYSESVELSAAYFRKQFDVVAAQTKDLAAQAQKVVRETTSMRNFAR